MRITPVLAILPLLMAGAASAQEPAPPPPPPAEPAPPPPPDPLVDPMGPSRPMVAPAASGMTDHEQIVGRWGIEARRLATLQKAPNQDRACLADCPVEINALSLRRWSTARYAWSAGLALGLGSGSTRPPMGGAKYSWDTYFGIGPTLGAAFLLADWKHLAVALSPQIDILYFLPGGNDPKTFLFNLRGLVEGEVHLGFMGLPQVSLGLSSGLVATLRSVSKAAETPSGTSMQWALGFTAPQSLWGLVTNMNLRFYF